MKVLMVNPPAAEGVKVVREGRCMQRKGAWTAVWAPLSLAITASVLREQNHQVKLVDCIVQEVDFDNLEKVIKDFVPGFVVFNATTPSLSSDLSVARVVHRESPNSKTAAIGIHGTALPVETLSMEQDLDFVVRGEPEVTVADLAKSIQGNLDFSGVQGISYRGNGEIIHNPDREPVKDLDWLPFPAWDLVDRDRYIMPFRNRRFLLVATGRGCPYPCNFCADATYYGKKIRLRSPKRVVDEMEWVQNQFGISDFLFWAESFTLKPSYAKQVAEEIIDRNLNFNWVCNSRVDNVDPQLLMAIKKAGCWMIGYGIESGSQQTLDRMKKGTTLDQARQAVKWAKQAGLEVTGHCVIGYPGETELDILKTITFAKELKLDFAQFYCAVPFPGSDLYNMANSSQWLVTSDWSRFEQNFSVLDTPQLTADQVMKLRARAYRSFYLDPRLIFRTMKRISSWNELVYFVKMAFDFMTWV